MDENKLFKNFALTDEEVTAIIEQYMPLINKQSKINGVLDEDCKQEIMLFIFTHLTKNRER